MTQSLSKKSSPENGMTGNRKERRQKAKQAEKTINEHGITWEELKNTYHLTKDMIIPINTLVQQLKDPVLSSFIHPDDVPLVSKNVKLLASIVRGFLTDVEDIYKNHANKTGSVDLMEYGLAMEINEKYLLLSQEAEGAFSHPYNHLIDILATAERRMMVQHGVDVNAKSEETIQESVQKHLDNVVEHQAN